MFFAFLLSAQNCVNNAWRDIVLGSNLCNWNIRMCLHICYDFLVAFNYLRTAQSQHARYAMTYILIRMTQNLINSRTAQIILLCQLGSRNAVAIFINDLPVSIWKRASGLYSSALIFSVIQLPQNTITMISAQLILFRNRLECNCWTKMRSSPD